MITKIFGVFVCLLLLGVGVISPVEPSSTMSSLPIKFGTCLYVGGSGQGNYSKIQDAITNASNGDIIFVFPGYYFETILINKTIHLLGRDRETTIIIGNFNYNVITLASDKIRISGFSIFNGSNGIEIFSDYCEILNTTIAHNRDCGIKMIQSNYTNIQGNNILDNDRGVSAYQSVNNSIFDNCFTQNNRALSVWYSSNYNIFSQNTFFLNRNDCLSLYYSSENQVIQNTFTHNNYSIFLFQSSKNNITMNRILSNNDVGILFEHSFDNFVYKNIISRNRNGVYLFCSYLNSIFNNSISENSDVGIYCSISLDNSSMRDDLVIPRFFQSVYRISVNLTEDNSIIGNSIINNTKGIVVEDTTNMTIQSNFIKYNHQYGIELVNSIQCFLEKNSISNNQVGIKLVNSVDCLIHFHTFSDNIVQAFFVNITRINWDSNYWDNWFGVGPKIIFGKTLRGLLWINFDWHPLKNPSSRMFD